jgi:hypothetical protein
MFKGINWVAVIVATIVVWLLGYVCFGVVFADLYKQLSPPGTPAIALNLETAKLLVPVFISLVVLAWVLVKTGSSSLNAALGTTFVVVFGFDTMVYAAQYLTGAPLHLMLLMAAFDMVTYLIAAVILTVLKGKAAA